MAQDSIMSKDKFKVQNVFFNNSLRKKGSGAGSDLDIRDTDQLGTSRRTLSDPPAYSKIIADFEILMKETAFGSVPVTKYRSKSTGLTLVHCETQGPLVQGYVVLATKADSDDGLPHTLEHLCFLGSEDYPKPMFLDKVALKCFAYGTNAWTAVDHTAYTIKTAGWEGFCRILPVYLDAVMYPLLTEDAYLTEVYHVTGEGKDGGVVYSEMQSKLLSGEEVLGYEMGKLLLPGTCYEFDTGGRLENLRKSTTLSKIRDYHKMYYNSKNCCIIVCGNVPKRDLFEACGPLIQKIITKREVIPRWSPPFANIGMPNLNGSLVKTVYFASDESEALVGIGFHGPPNWDIAKVEALRNLLDYLFETSIAPFQHAFVENDSPLASDVSYDLSEGATNVQINFDSVPKKRIKEILPLFRKTLEEIQNSYTFDMKRMGTVLKRNRASILVAMEEDQEILVNNLIVDFLIGGNDPDKFRGRLQTLDFIDDFMTRDSNFWIGLLKECILDKPWVTIYALSSSDEQKKNDNAEKERIKMRKATLGKEGLEALDRKLKDTMEKNRAPVPDELLQRIGMPGIKFINYHKIRRFEDPYFIVGDVDCKVFVDDIQTNFIHVKILMDSTQVKAENRRYLQVLAEAILESPIKLYDGTLVPYEQVVAGLYRDLLDYSADVGIDGFSHLFVMSFKFEMDKAREGFEWIRSILWNVEFKTERLRIKATNMANATTSLKRDGKSICSCLMDDIIFKNNSNVKACSCFRQQGFLKNLSKNLASRNKLQMAKAACFCMRRAPGTRPTQRLDRDSVLDTLNEIREILLDPNNMAISIAVNVALLYQKGVNLKAHMPQTFQFSKTMNSQKRLANQFDTYWMKNLEEISRNPRELVLGVCGIDSGYLYAVSPALRDFNHEDVAPLQVTIDYFGQMGGLLFNAVRGGGFSYGIDLDLSIPQGALMLRISPCNNTFLAYEAARNVIKAHLESDNLWSEETLNCAKGNSIYSLISKEKTPRDLAWTSLRAYLNNTPGDYNRQLTQKYLDVTLLDVKAMTRKYIAQLFINQNTSVIVCPREKVKPIANDFKKYEWKLEVLPRLNSCPLCKWEKDPEQKTNQY